MAREMKDSGIEWIGAIPSHWNINKIKHNFSIISGATPKSENADYWDGDICWVTPADYKTQDKFVSSGRRNLSRKGYEACGTTLVPADSIIFSKRAPVGTVAIASNELCTNQGCLSCVPYGLTNSRFYYYAMSVFTKQFELVSTGTTFKEIALDVFANFSLPHPPITEQKQISSFLETECSRIDSVIAQTRASIEEYKKLKQAVITQAVTKGIRPNRQMKDSRVEWIGEIPVDWHTPKVKYFATIRSGITLGKVYSSETKLVEYPYLRVANVKDSYVDLNDVAMIKVTEEEADKYRLQNGELLMTEGGDRDKLGRGTVWHAQIDPCLHQNHIFALKTSLELIPEYVSYISTSFVGRNYFDVTANQSVHLASTNSTTIMNFIIPYPSISEQHEIVDYLDKATRTIDKTISDKERLLTEIESYKKSLIYEYVTGKKEVPV